MKKKLTKKDELMREAELLYYSSFSKIVTVHTPYEKDTSVNNFPNRK
ncbi:MAG: hypothetical protein LBU04_02550 [Christensenellaceae bacterium]|jgi:hypothetical protein|nr:hypothetical protein [Christensenellaceae bacterium]